MLYNEYREKGDRHLFLEKGNAGELNMSICPKLRWDLSGRIKESRSIILI